MSLYIVVSGNVQLQATNSHYTESQIFTSSNTGSNSPTEEDDGKDNNNRGSLDDYSVVFYGNLWYRTAESV